MADSDSKKPPSIPAWQQKAANPTPNPQNSSSTSHESATAPTRATLLEQAKRFLQDESIANESPERKTVFLKSKGLGDDEVQSVLNAPRDTGMSDITPGRSESASESTRSLTLDSSTGSATPSSSQKETTVETTPSASSPSTSPSSSQSPTSTSTETPTPTPTSREIPPIITYPEFLFQPAKPPPLVSIRSVLYSLYTTAALGTGLYAASEYLVKPMLANLATARHDLADSTHTNLRTLNEKLEQTVSVVPPLLTSSSAAASYFSRGGTSISPSGNNDDDANDEDEDNDTKDDSVSITSDPTELWHRDVATQTSPESLTSPSTDNLADPTDPTTTTTTNTNTNTNTNNPTEKANTHTTRLQSLNSSLRDFLASEKQSDTVEGATRNRLSDLHTYLDGMMYSSPLYGAATGYGVFSSPGFDSSGAAAVGVGRSEEDAISSFKSEIRGVKGALLSARNFPAGGAARRGVGVGLSGAR